MTYDIVIPLSDTSRNHDVELRYALRSMESSCKTLTIVGNYLPSFINRSEVRIIPYQDIPNLRHKEKNVWNKILVACKDEVIDEDFLFANDDHFLLAPWVERYYHNGPLQAKYTNPYNQTILNTLALGVTDNYDIHCPIVYKKSSFLNKMANLEFPDWGYCIKSIYAHRCGISGVQVKDCKIDQPLSRVYLDKLLEGKEWFSVGDRFFDAHGEGRVWLQRRFPVKSRFEN